MYAGIWGRANARLVTRRLAAVEGIFDISLLL